MRGGRKVVVDEGPGGRGKGESGWRDGGKRKRQRQTVRHSHLEKEVRRVEDGWWEREKDR